MGWRATIPALREEATILEKQLRAVTQRREGELPAKVEAFRPGGKQNPERDAKGWYVWVRALAMALGRATPEDGAAAPEADRATVETLSGAPLTRRSLIAADDGAPVELTVYPKSFSTLAHLHGRDLILARLQPTVEALIRDEALDGPLVRRVLEAIANEHRLCAWIATTPGPGMPFEQAAPPPEFPEHVVAWHPTEVLQIREMHLEVNHLRIAATQKLLTPDTDPATGGSWSSFFATVAKEFGTAPEVLMHDRSLLSVLAQTQLIASEHRRHEQAADAKRAAGRD